MIKTLLAIRFRSLFAGLTAQNAKRNKKMGKGMLALYVFLYIYLLATVGGMMCFTFGSIAEVYHAMGFDWLYFTVAGTLALATSVLGNVFTTQNQLYDAKDNETLLAMPIQPQLILLSRIVPLLGLNLLFAGVVIIPATVMYAILVKVSFATIVFPLILYLAICILSQAIACFLGWLLHLLLSRVNKAAASMVYMIGFMAIYFVLYSDAGEIMNELLVNAQSIASGVKSWAWLLYVLGSGATGNILNLLIFVGICAAVFALVYYILSATFIATTTISRRGGKKKKMDLTGAKVSSARQAIAKKEFMKFLTSPVYLTNMGFGIIMIAAMAVAGIVMRDTILPLMQMLDPKGSLTSLLICAILAFAITTVSISTPSVSLESKNIWILKSMPVSPKQILMGKLQNHVVLTVPVSLLSGCILAITYNCSVWNVILCTLFPGLLALFSGVFGLWAGLHWARLDFINEAYPCKQSISVAVVMFGQWGLCVLLGVAYYFLFKWFQFPAIAFLALCCMLLAAACYSFYKIVVTYGVRKWESL